MSIIIRITTTLYTIPFLTRSHHGPKEEDMAKLATETKDLGFQLQQVQDFTPTPMTVAKVFTMWMCIPSPYN